MQYQVKMTMYATEQVRETVSYISHELLSPETAVGWANYLQKEIAGLDTFPARYPCIEEEPWRTKGIRKLSVKNFLIYYWIDEENSTVWITSVIYAKRDQIERLKEMPM